MRDLAHKNRAPALLALANRLSVVAHSGSSDVFGKIKGLISDMIAKLEEEAAADATKDAYCQKEMSETEAKKEKKETEVGREDVPAASYSFLGDGTFEFPVGFSMLFSILENRSKHPGSLSRPTKSVF